MTQGRSSVAIQLSSTQARRVNWVVKVSKLCNLRCRYCYEWNELGNKARISLEQWRLLLEAIRRYEERLGRESPLYQTSIIWHGGEPLLLPQSYFEAVLDLQNQILGSERLASNRIRNVLQTNLFAMDPRKIEFLHAAGFGIGVSMDVAGGMRLRADGRSTEDSVARNMDCLRERGIPFGGLVVLAAHTAGVLHHVYQFFEDLGVALRVLPLYDTPTNVNGAPFAISVARCISSMKKLFVKWMESSHRIPVAPLTEYLRVVLLRREGRVQPTVDRRVNEWAIIVNTDGELYERVDAYEPELALGNIFKKTIDEVLDSAEYAASLARDEREYRDRCSSCEYDGSCTRIPLLESRRTHHGNRCSIAYAMCEFIDQYVSRENLSRQYIHQVLEG